MMNAGQMRQEVIIEQRTAAQDAAGEPLVSWLLVARVRAEIERMTGREAWSSQQRQGVVPTIFHIRFHHGVVPQMRLTCNGKLYDIVSAIDPDGMRVETTLTCLELVDKVVEG